MSTLTDGITVPGEIGVVHGIALSVPVALSVGQVFQE
jgi:hypothetical protein